MYTETIEAVAQGALAKVELSEQRPWAALLHSAMAGAYVGLGILLIFLVGAPLSAAGSPVTSLVMGVSFGIALSLVIAAGADLFTGNTLVLPLGVLQGRVTARQALRAAAISYGGNLLGSLLVAVLAWQALSFKDEVPLAFVLKVAAKKTHLGFWPLLVRGMLCNWLVVLAVWCAYRLKSESGKLIMTFWCLFAFIASGYEHSVANMTLLSLANLLPHGDEVSWQGMLSNLIPVTLGNIISGSLFMAGAYWFVSKQPKRTNLVAVEPRKAA